MARKSILEGGARQDYSSCLADKCENRASKMTSFSGLGELRIVPKPEKESKPAPESREPYDPHTIHFAPLCAEHARQADSRGARSTNLTKKVAETWRQGEANISALKPAEVNLNPRKKKPRMTFMSGKATGTADPIQEYINYGVKNAKTKEEHEKFTAISHQRAVSSRRSEVWKDKALGSALKRVRNIDKEKEDLLSSHHEAVKQANEKYLKDTGATTERGNWNVKASEDNPFLTTHMRRTTRDYYFRSSKTPNREIVPHKPPKPKYVSTRKAKSAGPQKSGDIVLTGRQAAMERSLEPRLENIEKEYQQKKQARLAGKQFNQPAKLIVTPGN